MPDRLILISGGVILSLGFIKASLQGKPLTPTVEGGIVVVLLLSLLDSFGNDWSKFASAMAVLAMVAVIYSDLPAVASVFANPPTHNAGVFQGQTIPPYPGQTNPQ
jgi:hypothetical protein